MLVILVGFLNFFFPEQTGYHFVNNIFQPNVHTSDFFLKKLSKGKSDPVTGPVWPRGWVEV